MDGLTAIRRLRQAEAASGAQRRHLPVFAITGNARAEQVETCFDAGFDRCFAKPYDLSAVLEHVRAIVEAPSSPTA